MRAVWVVLLVAAVAVVAIFLKTGDRAGAEVSKGADVEAAEDRAETRLARPPGEQVAAAALGESPTRQTVAEIEPADEPEPPPKEAYVDVAVFELESQAPIAGATLQLVPFDEPDYRSALAPPRTDEEGKATLVVRAGERYLLHVTNVFGSRGKEVLSVPPLKESERRALQAYLATGYDGHFFGLVVADEDGSPLPDATVRVLDRHVRGGRFGEDLGKHTYFEARVDASGLFDLWFDPGPRTTAFASAPGRNRMAFGVTPGWSADRPFEIRLPRTGTARVTLLDGLGRPVGGAKVTLIAEGTDLVLGDRSRVRIHYKNDPSWSATTADDGTCVIAGAASNVGLDVKVQPPAAYAWWHLEELVLKPGVEQDVEIVAPD